MLVSVVLLAVAAGGGGGKAAAETRKHIDAAAHRFKAMDFTAALDELERAKKTANRKEEELQIALYTGVVKAYVGDEDAARESFKSALAIDSAAKLPVSVSPKVQALYDDVKKPKRDLPMPPPPDAAKPAPDAPVVAATPPLEEKPAPKAPALAPGDKPKLVVLDLAAAGGVPPEVASALTETATAEVAGRGFFKVVGAKEIQTLLGVERQKELLGGGCQEGNCLTQLSGLLGAQFVMSGTVTRLGSAYQLNLQVLDAEKSQPSGRSSRLAKDLESLRAQIPYAVAEACGTPLPPPPSRVVPYAVIAGGIAVLAGSALAGYDGLSRERVATTEFKASLANPTVLKPYSSYQSESSTISLEKTFSLIGLVAGAGLVATGVFLNPPEVVSGAGVRLTLLPTTSGVALVGVMP